MKSLRILIYCIIVSLPVTAQEMWGISNSNFSGNMGIFLNPTTIVGAPYQYEINLIAFDAFAENLNVYTLQNEKSVFHGLSGSIENRRSYDISGGLQNTFAHTLVIGPSYIRNKTQSAWGIHSAFRSEVSALNMSPPLAVLIYDNNKLIPPYAIRYSAHPFEEVNASWIELGGTKGKVFRESEKQIFKWAATINILAGLNGNYIDLRSLDYTPIDTSQLIVHSIDATFANAPGAGDNSFFGLRGLGLSSTLGLTYIKNPNRGAFDCNMSNDRQKKYKYRLGFSLLDLGMIRYFNQSEVINVFSKSDVLWNGIDTLYTGSIHAVDLEILSKTTGSYQKKGFSIWLPLALSVQFDYQLKRNLFANASVVNRIHFAKNQIARGNQVNASLRYERRRYEAALSLSVFEYKTPSLGLGLRYRFFVIGSDRLLSLLGISDANNFDIFAGIKFQFCKKPFSKGPDCPAYLSN